MIKSNQKLNILCSGLLSIWFCIQTYHFYQWSLDDILFPWDVSWRLTDAYYWSNGFLSFKWIDCIKYLSHLRDWGPLIPLLSTPLGLFPKFFHNIYPFVGLICFFIYGIILFSLCKTTLSKWTVFFLLASSKHYAEFAFGYTQEPHGFLFCMLVLIAVIKHKHNSRPPLWIGALVMLTGLIKMGLLIWILITLSVWISIFKFDEIKSLFKQKKHLFIALIPPLIVGIGVIIRYKINDGDINVDKALWWIFLAFFSSFCLCHYFKKITIPNWIKSVYFFPTLYIAFPFPNKISIIISTNEARTPGIWKYILFYPKNWILQYNSHWIIGLLIIVLLFIGLKKAYMQYKTSGLNFIYKHQTLMLWIIFSIFPLLLMTFFSENKNHRYLSIFAPIIWIIALSCSTNKTLRWLMICFCLGSLFLNPPYRITHQVHKKAASPLGKEMKLFEVISYLKDQCNNHDSIEGYVYTAYFSANVKYYLLKSLDSIPSTYWVVPLYWLPKDIENHRKKHYRSCNFIVSFTDPKWNYSLHYTEAKRIGIYSIWLFKDETPENS